MQLSAQKIFNTENTESTEEPLATTPGFETPDFWPLHATIGTVPPHCPLLFRIVINAVARCGFDIGGVKAKQRSTAALQSGLGTPAVTKSALPPLLHGSAPPAPLGTIPAVALGRAPVARNLVAMRLGERAGLFGTEGLDRIDGCSAPSGNETGEHGD
jgi:hypothetical protein